MRKEWHWKRSIHTTVGFDARLFSCLFVSRKNKYRVAAGNHQNSDLIPQKAIQNWVHYCWKHTKCTLEWFDNYFCTIKCEKYFQKRNNQSVQSVGPISRSNQSVQSATKRDLCGESLWLCTENFGPLGIPLPATNFLPQKQNREMNWQNCLIDSKTCCTAIWNMKFTVWSTRGKLCNTWVTYKECEKYHRQRNNSSVICDTKCSRGSNTES